jgi:hypothetical protein
MDWAAVDAKLPKTDFAKLEAEKAAAVSADRVGRKPARGVCCVASVARCCG